jgi:hypothetical protein
VWGSHGLYMLDFLTQTTSTSILGSIAIAKSGYKCYGKNILVLPRNCSFTLRLQVYQPSWLNPKRKIGNYSIVVATG